MKRFLFLVFVGVIAATPSLQAYYPNYSHRSTSCGDVLAAAAVVAGIAGIAGLTYCAIKQEPYDLFDGAKSLYDSVDRKTLQFMQRAATENYSLVDVAATIYVRSAYPLVTAAQQLEVVRGDTERALKKIRKALTLLPEECFVADCMSLREKLQSRLERIEELIIALHSHTLWPQYYALYVQETNVREMRYLQDRFDDVAWQRQPIVYVQPSYYVYENHELFY